MCADEKPSIQAGARQHPSEGAKPGGDGQLVEHEYTRGGALCYLAAGTSQAIISTFGVCYEPQDGSSLTLVSSIVPNFIIPTNNFYAQTVSGVVGGLSPRKYRVGLGAQDESSNVEHGTGVGMIILGETQNGVTTH